MQDCHGKCIIKQEGFHQATWLQCEEDIIKVLHLSIVFFFFADSWTHHNHISNTLKVLKYGAREGW
jgi:hypothetical protein